MFFWKKKATRITPTLEKDLTQYDNAKESTTCSSDDIIIALQQLKDGDLKFFFEDGDDEDDITDYGDVDIEDEDNNSNAYFDQEQIKSIITSMAFFVAKLTKEYTINNNEYKQKISDIIKTHYSELSERFFEGVRVVKYDVLDGQEWLKEKEYFFENVIYNKFGEDIENTIKEIKSLFVNTSSLDFKEYAKGTFPDSKDNINNIKDDCVDKIRVLLAENEIFSKFMSVSFYSGIKQLSLNMLYDMLENVLADEIKKHKIEITQFIEEPELTPLGYEKLCLDALNEAGWNSELTKSTGDQGADIIAKKNDKSLVVQCKYYSGGVGTKAVQEVIAARTYYCADYATVVTNTYFTPGATDLAKRGDVLLLNENELKNIDLFLKNS